MYSHPNCIASQWTENFTVRRVIVTATTLLSTLCIQMNFSIWINTLTGFIVHIKRSQVSEAKNKCIKCDYFLIHQFEHMFWVLKSLRFGSNTLYICFGGEIRKMFFSYTLLSGCLLEYNFVHNVLNLRSCQMNENLCSNHGIYMGLSWQYSI